MAYRVIAPFVNLKVKDPVTGAFAFYGLYEGAVVQDVDPDNLRHHLEQDPPMLEEIPDAAAPADEKGHRGSGRRAAHDDDDG
jgi:hypothetical protein